MQYINIQCVAWLCTGKIGPYEPMALMALKLMVNLVAMAIPKGMEPS